MVRATVFLPLSLMRGERAVWSGRYDVDRQGLALYLAFLLVPLWALGWAMMVGTCQLILDKGLDDAVWLLVAFPFWFFSTLGVVIVSRGLCAGVVVGDRHLVVRSFFTNHRIPLDTIRSCQRCASERWNGEHYYPVQTHEIEIVLADGRVVTFGAVLECEDLVDMLEGVRTLAIVPEALPSITGEAALIRTNARVAPISQSRDIGGDRGRLVVTPRWLVHFTTPLRAAQEARLVTLLAMPGSLENIEDRLVALARGLPTEEVRLIDRILHTARLVDQLQLVLESPSGDAPELPPVGYREPAAEPAVPIGERIAVLAPDDAWRLERFLRRTA